MGRKYESGIGVGDGLLDAVRLGQNTLFRSRLVIDLERYDHHRLFTLPSPARIVVDVYGDRRRLAPDSNGRLPAELRRVHTVVVDPGHGGRDPGATGVGGLREKDVNLAISKRLAKGLERRGFNVVLTRNDDLHQDREGGWSEPRPFKEARGTANFRCVGRGGGRMILRRLRLKNYRKYRTLELEFPTGLIGVMGRNGSGKTTIFEGTHRHVALHKSRLSRPQRAS